MKSFVLMLGIPPILAVYVISIVLMTDTANTMPQYLLIAPMAFILGSVPWGYMLIRFRHQVDIRDYGSGRIGTTNVFRTAGKPLAALVLGLDLSKGILAILLARAISDAPVAEAIAGLLVLAGHMWSPFLGFRGGRGIAPGAGVMLIVAPIAVGISLVIFGLVTYVTRYVSLGSLIGAMSTVALLLLQVAISDADPAYLIFGILGVAIILWQHRDNVKRLIDRTERRLGQSDDSILTK